MEDLEELKRKEEHRKRHEELHLNLMELLNDFLHSREHANTIKVDDFVEWSYSQTQVMEENNEGEPGTLHTNK
jgi:hypothetical protein